MKVIEKRFYNGAEERIQRLGIDTFEEILDLLGRQNLRLLEERNANGGAAVRELIDSLFEGADGWTKTQTGDIDWRKCLTFNGREVCIGVEVQVSARSDLVVIDILHLRNAIENGSIDVGVIIVPSDTMAYYLTDRCPSLRETINAIEHSMRGQNLPIVVLAIEHDGPGAALPKRKRRK